MNAEAIAAGKVFARLFDRLDVYDKVEILRYMVELAPQGQEDKVVEIDAYRRPGKEIKANESKGP